MSRIGLPRSLSLPTTRSASRIALTSGVVTTIASARAGDRIAKTRLDAGRTVDQHVIALSAALFDDGRKLLFGNRIFFARLRGRQNRQRLEALIFDQRLAQLAASFGDLDEIEHDPLF